ncbi:MAG: hypothetical protein JHD02_08165 [Thermoleophilaceae bacterium]|nr:hypothetical protein [Thermoleophilaceae bacterium]
MSKQTKSRTPYFNDLLDLIPPFAGDQIQVIGNPMAMTGPPVVREARLEDCDDDCDICVELRRQILAGSPPQVMVFE